MKRKYEIVGLIIEINDMLILHETIGGRFETKEFEGDMYIHLDKSYINFFCRI